MSRSEAGQQKHLLVLNSDWQQQGEVLLDLGPRFHAMAGAEPALPQGIRPGDRSAAVLLPGPSEMALGSDECMVMLCAEALVMLVILPGQNRVLSSLLYCMHR